MARSGRLKAPTLEYLEGLRTELQAVYQNDDVMLRRLRSVRTMDQPVPLDKDWKLVDIEVRDPTVNDEIQRTAAMLSLNLPRLQVRQGETDKAQENSTLREQWTEEVLWRAGSYGPPPGTWPRLVDAQCEGGGWTKLVCDWDLWEQRYSVQRADETVDSAAAYDKATEEAKKLDGPPFRWLPVDTLSVYPVWSGRRVREVLEIQERPVYSTLREHRLAYNAQRDIVSEELGLPENQWEVKRGSSLLWLEHWDDTWVTYAIMDTRRGRARAGSLQMVDQWEHGYGRVPYFYTPGLTFNSSRNAKVGWSIAEGKRWLVEYRSFLWTLHAQAAARDTLPPLKRTMPETAAPLMGDDGQPRGTERYDLKSVTTLRPGEDMRPIEFQLNATALKEEIALVSEAIAKLETPRVTNIGGLEGAGFAISQVLHETRVKWGPLLSALETTLADVTRFLWELMRRKVREPVWVYGETAEKPGAQPRGWLSAGPDDLSDGVQIHWDVNAEQPSNALIEWRLWHERISAGTASIDQALEAMGDNPDEVRRGRTLDRLREKPWYQQLEEKAVLQKARRGDLLRQVAAVAAATGVLPGQQQGGGQGPMGQTGMPPDAGNLALAPGGAGAAPARGSVVGSRPGVVVPEAGAGAGIQQLNVGR